LNQVFLTFLYFSAVLHFIIIFGLRIDLHCFYLVYIFKLPSHPYKLAMYLAYSIKLNFFFNLNKKYLNVLELASIPIPVQLWRLIEECWMCSLLKCRPRDERKMYIFMFWKCISKLFVENFYFLLNL
jgi:hypothetical protein